ncbi:LysR substrate-binding domain-containing protein [Leucobacter aridicollis]|uniref:LysR substrate-binding domain-containing protein n=1 Tax=Leucobacter aridicollis TaxID=283878 RepID=UPI000E65E9DB|nr:LysR substrate-binding domain-containing protein [Leucobacter aridicollis]UTX52686.1 LysR family transcriptional regulator substrate-binding protein [Leucobacter aridicollis]
MTDTPEPTAAAEIQLGFTRGVAPSKWVRRWNAISPEQPLSIVPFPKPYGRPEHAADFDMILERTAPGGTPVGADDGAARTHHALRLYDEAVALVLPKGHDFTGRESVSIADLAEVRLLDHPDHAPDWPAAEAWEDPAWMPVDVHAALDIVATGLGGILMPAPLARHIVDKHAHLTVRLEEPIVGGSIWASWPVERDAPDMQHLAGVMRGRTARSSRGAQADAQTAPKEPKRRQQPKAKAKPKLKPNSRGAQLQAAAEKREREKAERRRAKRK